MRHVRDAEHLLEPGDHQSLDQAYHLAGFGPECARKAAIPARTYDQAIGHGIGRATDRAIDYALATDAAAHRFALQSWHGAFPQLAKWTEASRYERTGTRGLQEAAVIVAQARSLVDRLTYALWADGMIPRTFSW